MQLANLIIRIIILHLIITNSFAQIKVIEIDSVTNAPSEVLPFDQPFILKIPTTTQKSGRVAFVPHIGKASLARSLELRRLDAEQKNIELSAEIYKISELNNNDHEVRLIGKKNYLLIYFRGDNLLDPGKNYTIFWTEYANNHPIIKLFRNYYEYKERNNKDAGNQVEKIYNELAESSIKSFGFEMIFYKGSKSEILERIDYYYLDPKSKLKEKYNLLELKESAYNRYVDSTNLHTTLPGTSLQVLLEEISRNSDHLDSNLKTVYLADIRKATRRIIKLSNLDVDVYRRLLRGEENLDCNACKAIPFDQYDTRAGNLKETLGAVEELYALAEALKSSRPSSLPYIATSLRAFRNELQKMSKDFDEIMQAQKAITDEISRFKLFPLGQLAGSTYINSFETRNKLSLAPDFGVVTTRIGKDQSNPYSFIPYLGFHVNFRPINRDLPFWSYRHKLLHYGSLMFGWSLVSIDNGPNQATGVDSVASFFSKGKGTLLTGLGLRLGNAVRVTGGLTWYFKYYPSSADPAYYDKRKLKNWPFIGLSLDLSLKDLMNGISDVFTGAPRAFRPPAPISAVPVN